MERSSEVAGGASQLVLLDTVVERRRDACPTDDAVVERDYTAVWTGPPDRGLRDHLTPDATVIAPASHHERLRGGSAEMTGGVSEVRE
jgi:hypothetical protein